MLAGADCRQHPVSPARFVHEDEAEAQKAGADLGGLFAGGSMDMMMTMGMIGAAMNGVPKGVPLDPSKAPGMSFSPGWYGVPEQALAMIEQIHSVVGMGRGEFIVGGTPKTSHESVVPSLRAMGDTMVPDLHGDCFRWRPSDGGGEAGREERRGRRLHDPVLGGGRGRSCRRPARRGRSGAVGRALHLLSSQNRVLLFELPGWGDDPTNEASHSPTSRTSSSPRWTSLGSTVRTSWNFARRRRRAGPRARPSRSGRVDGARVARCVPRRVRPATEPVP